MLEVKEEIINIKVADLKKLIGEISELKDAVNKLTASPDKSGEHLLTAKDVMNDLRISRKTLDRRMYDDDFPLPMVLDGHKLKIRKDKYDAWKRARGL